MTARQAMYQQQTSLNFISGRCLLSPNTDVGEFLKGWLEFAALARNNIPNHSVIP